MKNYLLILCSIFVLFSCQQGEDKKVEEPIQQTVEPLNDDVQIKHIQVGGENADAKNKLHISYPDTKYDFINQSEEEFVQAFFQEFKNEKDNLGENSVSGVDFGQHFELLEDNNQYIVFLIDRYTSFGNNYDTKYFTHIYNLSSKEELKFSDLFRSDKSFEEFSKVAYQKTLETVNAKVQHLNDLSEEDKTSIAANLVDMVAEGTEPKADNYDGFRWNKNGDITLLFDKYQVASGDFGAIEVTIPSTEYKHLILKEHSDLLHVPIEVEKKQSKPKTNKVVATTANKSIDCGAVPCVALTFDDGPAKYTNQLLDILKAENVQATFFVLGKSAKIQNNTVLRAYKEGHQIANHSWDHKDLKKLSNDAVAHQVNDTNEAIEAIIGQKPTVLRPPYGSFNSNVKSIAEMPIILWSVDPLDWKDRNSSIVEQRITEQTNQNGIVLSHDIHKTTVEAMPEVIKNLKSKGFHLVTIDQLFAGKQLENGKTYSRR